MHIIEREWTSANDVRLRRDIKRHRHGLVTLNRRKRGRGDEIWSSVTIAMMIKTHAHERTHAHTRWPQNTHTRTQETLASGTTTMSMMDRQTHARTHPHTDHTHQTQTSIYIHTHIHTRTYTHTHTCHLHTRVAETGWCGLCGDCPLSFPSRWMVERQTGLIEWERDGWPLCPHTTLLSRRYATLQCHVILKVHSNRGKAISHWKSLLCPIWKVISLNVRWQNTCVLFKRCRFRFLWCECSLRYQLYCSDCGIKNRSLYCQRRHKMWLKIGISRRLFSHSQS